MLALALACAVLLPAGATLHAQEPPGCELTPSIGAVVPAGELSEEVGLGVVGAGRVSCPLAGRVRVGGGLDISVFPSAPLDVFLFQFLAGPELQLGSGAASWRGRVALEAGWTGVDFLGSSALGRPPRVSALTSGFTTGARVRASRTLGGSTRWVIGVAWQTMFFEPEALIRQESEGFDPATTFPVSVGIVIGL